MNVITSTLALVGTVGGLPSGAPSSGTQWSGTPSVFSDPLFSESVLYGPEPPDPAAPDPGTGSGVTAGSGEFLFVRYGGAGDVGDEPEWQERALCAQTDPEAFFPEKGGSTREAKRICSGCDVRAECLDYALAHDERFGIWGGLSERERRRLRRAAG